MLGIPISHFFGTVNLELSYMKCKPHGGGSTLIIYKSDSSFLESYKSEGLRKWSTSR